VLEEEGVISVIQYGLSDRWTEENDDNSRADGIPRRSTSESGDANGAVYGRSEPGVAGTRRCSSWDGG
jgi:hypothetical protein